MRCRKLSVIILVFICVVLGSRQSVSGNPNLSLRNTDGMPYGFVNFDHYSEYSAYFLSCDGEKAYPVWNYSDQFRLYQREVSDGSRELVVPYLGDAPMPVDRITVYDARALYGNPNLHETFFTSRDTLGVTLVLREYIKPFSDYAKEENISDFLNIALPDHTNYYNYRTRDVVYKAVETTMDIGGILTEVFCCRDEKSYVKIIFVSGDFLVEIWDWGGSGARDLLADFSLQPLKGDE